MNRRSLIKGAMGLAAGIILPTTLIENTEAARRYWALDQTMVSGQTLTHDQLARILSGLFGQPAITQLEVPPTAIQFTWKVGEPSVTYALPETTGTFIAYDTDGYTYAAPQPNTIALRLERSTKAQRQLDLLSDLDPGRVTYSFTNEYR